jgi:hypothetical protein
MTSTVPPGRDLTASYPGTSCLATISLSLRDKTISLSLRDKAIRPSKRLTIILALMGLSQGLNSAKLGVL